MGEEPGKKPNSNLETLFGLIDSLQKHKRKLAQKPEPVTPEMKVDVPSRPFSFKPLFIGISVLAIIGLIVVILKWKTPEPTQIKRPVIVEAPVASTTQRNSRATTITAPISTFPRRILPQPVPVAPHLQTREDPEEQRERELREQEYDRLQNPELPPLYAPPGPPEDNNISN